jgi:hypothetical protein
MWIALPGLLIVFFVTAELLVRQVLRHGRAYYVFAPGQRLRLHLDRDVFPELEPVVRFEVNSDGERGNEVPRSRLGTSLYRVLVVGGSQPEGYLLDQDTAWPGALQQLLASPQHERALGASSVHVGSIARSGVGSAALNLIFDHVLPRYQRLQAIVILVGASDVLQWLEQGTPAVPLPIRHTDVFRCCPDGFGWKPRRLAVFEWLRRMRLRWLRPVHVHERAGHWVGKARAMRAHATRTLTTVPDPAPMLDHFEANFRTALASAKSRADRVLVVRQPWFDKVHTPEESAMMWHGGAGQVWREQVTTFYSVEVLCQLMALLDRRRPVSTSSVSNSST